MLKSGIAVGVVVVLCLGLQAAGDVITDDDIVGTSAGMVGSGNGTLDLILFGSAGGGGVTENAAADFDGDDANTDVAKGGSSSMSESYITSMGEIREFYRLNFPDGAEGSLVDEIAIFVDMNETTQNGDITLNELNIVIDYGDFPEGDPRNDPLNNDISSEEQNSTGSGYVNGTLAAWLDSSPKILPWTVLATSLGFQQETAHLLQES